MDTRVAVLAIIVKNPDSVSALNDLLHQYGQYIIGRMGVPYQRRDVNIISVAMKPVPPTPQLVPSRQRGKFRNRHCCRKEME